MCWTWWGSVHDPPGDQIFLDHKRHLEGDSVVKLSEVQSGKLLDLLLVRSFGMIRFIDVQKTYDNGTKALKCSDEQKASGRSQTHSGCSQRTY